MFIKMEEPKDFVTWLQVAKVMVELAVLVVKRALSSLSYPPPLLTSFSILFLLLPPPPTTYPTSLNLFLLFFLSPHSYPLCPTSS
jgi:hypothetical protein